MARVKQLLEDFASLHEGGAVASVKDKVHPLNKNVTPEEYLAYVAEHLDGDVPIGVYPLWQLNNVWMVNWVAVDLDEGDISDVHADNLVALLTKMSIKSWKEPSRSKGYHAWVYLTSLDANKIGNCLRLPYPKIRSKGKQVVDGYNLKDFTEEAIQSRTPASIYRKLLPLHTATEPTPLQKFSSAGSRTDGNFVGTAEEIWNNPHMKRGAEATDRSATLYAFAGSLLWQEYSIAATIDWVRRLDDRLGKYVDRSDREKRLEALVQRAAQEVKVRE